MGKYTRAIKWAIGYVAVILLFAFFYFGMPSNQWGGNERINDFLNEMARCDEMRDFIKTDKRNPSKHRIEEYNMLNWVNSTSS